VEGDQEQLTPPEPVSGVEDPLQIDAEPTATAVGRAHGDNRKMTPPPSPPTLAPLEAVP
jgi:hypothetical protein